MIKTNDSKNYSKFEKYIFKQKIISIYIILLSGINRKHIIKYYLIKYYFPNLLKNLLGILVLSNNNISFILYISFQSLLCSNK